MNQPRPPLPPEVLDALRRGQPLEAIKRLRAAGGLGLREAKQLVDAHRAGQAAESTAARPVANPHQPHLGQPGLAPGEVPRTRGGLGWVILALVLGAIAYVLMRDPG